MSSIEPHFFSSKKNPDRKSIGKVFVDKQELLIDNKGVAKTATANNRSLTCDRIIAIAGPTCAISLQKVRSPMAAIATRSVEEFLSSICFLVTAS